MATDPRWERVRVAVGIALVALCGLALWKNSVRPLVEKGLGGKDLVREVRLGVFRLALERKREELQREEREEKERERARAEQAADGAAGISGGSGGAVSTGTLRGGSR
jgi:hypothetical protein